jgi:hypothetical protein
VTDHPDHTTEVQPPQRAGATVTDRTWSKWATRPLDPALPYCTAAYRLDEPNPFDGSRPWLIAWSCWKEPAFPAMRTVYDAAVYETARVRVEHHFHGPLLLLVWQTPNGQTADYRATPPAHAYALTTGVDDV